MMRGGWKGCFVSGWFPLPHQNVCIGRKITLCTRNMIMMRENSSLQMLHLLTLGAHAQRGLLYLGLSVCVSVKSHLTYGASVGSENVVTYSAGNEGQKSGDLPQTTSFKSYTAKHKRKSQYANFSDLPAVSFLRLT